MERRVLIERLLGIQDSLDPNSKRGTRVVLWIVGRPRRDWSRVTAVKGHSFVVTYLKLRTANGYRKQFQ